MADSTIDWTDETLRPLDELARLAFPAGGVTGKTLRLRARQGKLLVYRPGKAYLASLSCVRAMIEKTRVHHTQERETPPPAIVSNSLGLTETDLARSAFERALAPPGRPAKVTLQKPRVAAAAEQAHRLEMKERRRARARAKYRQKVSNRSKSDTKP